MVPKILRRRKKKWLRTAGTYAKTNVDIKVNTHVGRHWKLLLEKVNGSL